jgi:hypothetical protein
MELFKFTDEELSRVLSAHAGGQLISGGVGWWDCAGDYPPGGCLIQVARHISGKLTAFGQDKLRAARFDGQYNPLWSMEEFIQWLRKEKFL